MHTTASSLILRRDPFLDSLRGIFHVLMLVDHLPFILPGMFTITAGFFEAFGYITVAEGFVFLSGFVSGLVYTRTRREKGTSAVWRKALIRARDIYLCYILAVVSLVAVVKVVGSSEISWGAWDPLLSESLPIAFIKVATLLQQPTFLEILPMYSVFIVLTPFLIGQLENNRLPLVLVVSGTVWFAAQFNARNILFHLLPVHGVFLLGYFNSLGWQILFVSGLVCGHKTYTSKQPWLPNNWQATILAYLVASALFLLRHNVLGMTINYRLIGRANLGPLRLLNFFCIVFLLCKTRRYVEKCISWKGFAFLSKHSLQVFAFHLFPIYLATLFLSQRMTLPAWAQLFFILFCVTGLFQIAFLAQCYTNVLRRFKGKRPAVVAKWAPD